MKRIRMVVEYTIEFRGTDDEIGELSLEGDILFDLIGRGEWQEDGWRVTSSKIVGEVKRASLAQEASALCPYCGGSGPKGDKRWHRHDCPVLV